VTRTTARTGDYTDSTPGARQVLWVGNSVDWILPPVRPAGFLEVQAALGQLLCEGR
jgi:hypothetical protein